MPIAGQSPKEVIHTELHKFKHGQLHSGSHQGPLVKNRRQAIAIALSEAGKAHRDSGGQVGQGFGNLLMGLEQSGQLSPQMMPWAAAALGMPAMMGLFDNYAAPQQPAYLTPGAAAPQGPAYDPGQAPVVPTTSVAPSMSTVNARSGVGSYTNTGPQITGPSAGWAEPSFSGGQWGNTPGRDLGGGMIKAPNPNWMVRNEARSMMHSGPISSIVPGRTDRHNVHVGSGSYVMPADAVSHIGQNNTQAGQAILSHMFGSAGPYGTKDMPIKHGPGAPRAAPVRSLAQPKLPKFQSEGGGKGDDRTGEPVPVVVAGGEFTIPPEAVLALGGGDIKRGHRILDKWVLSLRKKHIATLKGLPPPAKD